jgi:hypothetical protein
VLVLRTNNGDFDQILFKNSLVTINNRHVDSETFKHVNVTLDGLIKKNTEIGLESIMYFLNDLVVILKSTKKIIGILDFLLNVDCSKYVKVKCNLYKLMINSEEYECVLIAILRDVEQFVKGFVTSGRGKDCDGRIDMIVEI